MHRCEDGRVQRRMVARVDARAVARGVREGVDAHRDPRRERRARPRVEGRPRHLRHERGVRPRRDPERPRPRVPLGHDGSDSRRGPATARAHGGPRPLPRPTVHHASLGHAHALDLPRLPARRDRAHRPPPPPSARPSLRREAESHAARTDGGTAHLSRRARLRGAHPRRGVREGRAVGAGRRES